MQRRQISETYLEYFRKIKAYLLEIGLEAGRLEGLSAYDIFSLENRYSQRFPDAYAAWLAILGGKPLATWDPISRSPVKDLIYSQEVLHQYREALGPRVAGKLFFSYYPEAERLNFVELSSENPPVWTYGEAEKTGAASFNLLSISFIGYIRETIIAKLESMVSKFALIPWVESCAYFLNQNPRIYLEKRKAFARFVEARELAGGPLLMPDEMQVQWLHHIRSEESSPFHSSS